MIPVVRGAEPDALRQERRTQLARAILADQKKQSPAFVGYDIAKSELATAHHHKCCYCEMPLREESTPVEHFRPKAGVQNPGDAKLDSSRYWWLAWTWENLLFACDRCNSHYKLTQFPLQPGSQPLSKMSVDLDSEKALLIDPSRIDPRLHFRFEWSKPRECFIPMPINGSLHGKTTLTVLGLDQADDRRDSHVLHLKKHELPPLREVLAKGNQQTITATWKRLCEKLFAPGQPFHAVTWDLLDYEVPEAERSQWGLLLPTLGQPAPILCKPLFDGQDDPPEFAQITEELKLQIRALGKKAPASDVLEVVRLLFVQKKWTQKELAHLLGRSQSAVSGYLASINAAPNRPLSGSTK